jgi:hypothetical protein
MLQNIRLLLKKGNTVKLINPETKTFRVFSALQKGEAVTAAKAKKMGKPSRNMVALAYKAQSLGLAV